MAYSFKGGLSFGLVYIPIMLQSSIKNNDISFNMLDKKTMSRVKYVKTCVDCDDREVKQKDIVKGYQYEKDKYVVLEDEDFEKIKTKKDKNITIEAFVNAEEIDPMYYDRPYYVVPNGAEKAFQILLLAMEKGNKVAIAKTVLGTKECLIAIRCKNGQMLLNTLFFQEEVLKNPAKIDLKEIDETKLTKELKMAKSIIDSMTTKFKPEKYKDEYREKLMNAIEKKIKGKQIHKARERKETKVINLMDALKKSLKEMEKHNIKTKSTKSKAKKSA